MMAGFTTAKAPSRKCAQVADSWSSESEVCPRARTPKADPKAMLCYLQDPESCFVSILQAVVQAPTLSPGRSPCFAPTFKLQPAPGPCGVSSRCREPPGALPWWCLGPSNLSHGLLAALKASLSESAGDQLGLSSLWVLFAGTMKPTQALMAVLFPCLLSGWVGIPTENSEESCRRRLVGSSV